MPEPTPAMNDYMKATFHLDPANYPPPAKHGKKPEGHDHEEPGGEKEEGKEFSHEFPVATKKIKVAGDRLEITLDLHISVSCTITATHAGDSHVDLKNTAKALGRFIIGWADKTAIPALSGGGGLFKSLKLESRGGAELLNVTASAETETMLGKFSLEFVAVKLSMGAGAGHKPGATLTLEAAKASAKLHPHKVVLPDVALDGINVTKLTLEAGAAIALAPDWKTVLGKWAAQNLAEDALEEAGEAVVTAVGADVIITGSFVAVGLSVIFGTLYSLAQGSQIGDLAISVKPGIVEAKQGFKLAMQGYKSPTSPLGAAGWQAGHQNRDALVKQVQKQYPDAPESHIQEQIAGIAEQATRQAEDTIVRAVRTGLWDGYLKANTHLLMSGDARWAFVACFGDSPKDGDPEWKKYLDQHKYGQSI